MILVRLAGDRMKRFVEGVDRGQSTLFPDCLEDWIVEDNPVRVIDAFVDALDLGNLGFSGVEPEATGRPSYHPSVLLKLSSTAISTGFSRAAGLSGRPPAMSR
jgi:transposase